jgi:hypothetical protein
MTAYERWIATYVRGSVRGRCAAWTRQMQRTFPELQRVYGFVVREDLPPQLGVHRLQGHWWLVTPTGAIVDPTQRQFGWPLVYVPLPDLADRPEEAGGESPGPAWL